MIAICSGVSEAMKPGWLRIRRSASSSDGIAGSEYQERRMWRIPHPAERLDRDDARADRDGERRRGVAAVLVRFVMARSSSRNIADVPHAIQW